MLAVVCVEASNALMALIVACTVLLQFVVLFASLLLVTPGGVCYCPVLFMCHIKSRSSEI